MDDGESNYYQFCQNHDDSDGCTDFRADALRARGIDPTRHIPDGF